MKVTVFGGSGFLGSHICDKLSDAGHDVTIVDVRPSPWLRDDQKMVVGSIPEGAVFYGETRRREVVPLTEELRQTTQKMADEMHAYFARGYTPKSKPGTHCNACSLKELCLPVLYQRADPKAYLRAHLDEMQEAVP